MSVAGPVVPTKEDGEVDQDRSGHSCMVILILFIFSPSLYL